MLAETFNPALNYNILCGQGNSKTMNPGQLAATIYAFSTLPQLCKGDRERETELFTKNSLYKMGEVG